MLVARVNTGCQATVLNAGIPAWKRPWLRIRDELAHGQRRLIALKHRHATCGLDSVGKAYIWVTCEVMLPRFGGRLSNLQCGGNLVHWWGYVTPLRGPLVQSTLWGESRTLVRLCDPAVWPHGGQLDYLSCRTQLPCHYCTMKLDTHDYNYIHKV